MPSRVRLLVNQVPITAELRPEGLAFPDSDGSYQAIADFDGRFRIESPAGTTVALAAVAGNIVWVGIDDEVFECRLGAAAASGARARDADALAAPMPATVVKIAVHPGQTVATGDLLIALEAMKMEFPLRAPRTGTVAAIHCREGELVQPGVVLIDIGEP